MLRRKLALQQELHRPRWGSDVDRVLRRCLLLNRWDRSSPGDIETVARFVGKPYEDIEERLEQLGNDDPPLMRMGSTLVCGIAGGCVARGWRPPST